MQFNKLFLYLEDFTFQFLTVKHNGVMNIFGHLKFLCRGEWIRFHRQTRTSWLALQQRFILIRGKNRVTGKKHTHTTWCIEEAEDSIAVRLVGDEAGDVGGVRSQRTFQHFCAFIFFQ